VSGSTAGFNYINGTNINGSNIITEYIKPNSTANGVVTLKTNDTMGINYSMFYNAHTGKLRVENTSGYIAELNADYGTINCTLFQCNTNTNFKITGDYLGPVQYKSSFEYEVTTSELLIKNVSNGNNAIDMLCTDNGNIKVNNISGVNTIILDGSNGTITTNTINGGTASFNYINGGTASFDYLTGGTSSFNYINGGTASFEYINGGTANFNYLTGGTASFNYLSISENITSIPLAVGNPPVNTTNFNTFKQILVSDCFNDGANRSYYIFYPTYEIYYFTPDISFGSGTVIIIRFPIADLEHVGCKFTIVMNGPGSNIQINLQTQQTGVLYDPIFARFEGVSATFNPYLGYCNYKIPQNQISSQAGTWVAFGQTSIAYQPSVTFVCLPNNYTGGITDNPTSNVWNNYGWFQV
jgi:hypothetical protein